MIRITYILCFLLVATVSKGQFSNEWIDFSQQYYKLETAQDGIYRFAYQDMLDAGIPVASIDPRRVQLFHRGVEVAIHFSGQADGQINPEDFLEFYGTRNDGNLDTDLYVSEYAQPHTKYNLFSDTTAYFFTWNYNNINGKRARTYNLNPGALIPENYGFKTISKINTQRYLSGRNIETAGQLIAFSQYDSMEGFGSLNYNTTTRNTGDFIISKITDRVITGPAPKLKILLMGERTGDHLVEIYVGPDLVNLRLLGSVALSGYNKANFEQIINWSDVSPSGELNVRVINTSPVNPISLINIPLLELSYASEFVSVPEGMSLDLEPNALGQSLLEVNPASASLKLWDITNQYQVEIPNYTLNAGVAKGVVDNTDLSKKVWIQDGFFDIKAQKVTMRELDPAFNDYIILSHSTLLKKDNGANPIDDFAGYRNSINGGGYDTLVLAVEDVYNQFNFGEVSPMAIYNFVDYISQIEYPGYLFIVGKGLSTSYNYYRNPENPAFDIYKNLIPPGGDPASDMIYASRAGSYNEEPTFPVARLPVMTVSEAEAYFNKVREYESLPFDALWRKDILHLSGGITVEEQELFFAIVERFRGTAEGPRLGGKVTTIRKNVVENTTFINVSGEVNEGKGLVTFFGHSGPAATDLEIGFASDPSLGYNNAGKYPVMLVNGCQAGFIFSNNRLFGEDWIVTGNKGAVGFISNTGYTRADNLVVFSNIFYSNGYSDSVFVNKTLGEVLRKSLADFRLNNSLGLDRRTYPAMITQTFLMGDPAINLFGAEKPDFHIEENTVEVVSVDQSPVTAQSDTFAIKLVVNNFGLAPGTPFTVSLSRFLPDNTQLLSEYEFVSTLYSDTLYLKVHNDQENSNSGNNIFSIQIDSDFFFDEIRENNNTYAFTENIPQSGSLNLIPYQFSIVSTESPTLVFQNSDASKSVNEFVVQIDTSRFFDSPFMQSYTVNGGLSASQEVSLLSNDSTVYFWRSRVITGEPTALWDESSFTFINGSSPGWSQGSFFEQTYGSYLKMNPDTLTENWVFNFSELDLAVHTYGATHGSTVNEVSVKLNDDEYNIRNINKACRSNTINFIAFNRETADPYLSFGDISSSQIDLKSCGRSPYIINSFSFSELESGFRDLQTYLDGVNFGDSVVVFTMGDIQFQNWTAGMKSLMSQLGFSTTFIEDSGLGSGSPFIGFGAKNAVPGTAEVIVPSVAPFSDQELIYNNVVTGIPKDGWLTSARVGPALAWGSVVKSLYGLDNPTVDNNTVDVISGNNVMLDNVGTGLQDISFIDAFTNPELNLEFHTIDSIKNTPGQINRWTVLYDPAPEGIIWRNESEDIPVVVREGEKAKMSFHFMNVSPWLFPDSLTVTYELINVSKGTRTVNQTEIVAPQPSDTVLFFLEIDTRGHVGMNDLVVHVNPGITPEQNYYNNRLKLQGAVNVQKDNLNPLVFVSFDGRKIINGDVVSSSPEIAIKLRDDNNYLPLNDTTFLNFYIATENGAYERISFSNQAVEWQVSESGQEFTVTYQSGYLQSGVYKLKVEARDASGNLAGEEPFEIWFEVINESTITRFYPFPNPFSSNMRFVFTVTGDQVPDYINIRILTITGRVVREIDQDDLGPVYVGNNISQFSWDGTDQYGNQLANGVYLYKVTAKINGEEIELRAHHGDRGFKNGIGKIYLAR